MDFVVQIWTPECISASKKRNKQIKAVVSHSKNVHLDKSFLLIFDCHFYTYLHTKSLHTISCESWIISTFEIFRSCILLQKIDSKYFLVTPFYSACLTVARCTFLNWEIKFSNEDKRKFRATYVSDIYVCIYVHMYPCMYVCTYVCMNVSIYVHMFPTFMYVHMYVCMYVCM
jgi:hypothetical protein